MSEDKTKPAGTAADTDAGEEAKPGAGAHAQGEAATPRHEGAPLSSDEAAVGETEGEDGGPHPVVIIEALQKEIGELKNQLLRAHAEIDNQRKRYEKDKSEIAKYAISKFATDILQVGDNFQRAIDAVPAEAADNDPALKSFLEGVNMAEREFLNTLERHGVKRMVPVGEAFNPHFHQAIMQQEHATAQAGTVLHVIQAGYVLEERVLRPAMVVVAKASEGDGPPAEGPAGPSDVESGPDAGGSG